MEDLPILFIGFVFLSILFYLFRARQRYVASHANGCLPPKRFPHWDPVLGLDLFFNTKKLLEENKYLTSLSERYNSFGRTFEVNLLGVPSINSIEPRNLQAVHMNIKDWGVEPIRLTAQEEFCGPGFITTDGAHWEHSLALIKPSLKRGNIEFTSLERGLQLVFKRIPRDGYVLSKSFLPSLHHPWRNQSCS